MPRQRCHVNMMSWIPCHVRTGPFFIGLYVAHHEILYWAAPTHYSIIVLGCSSPLFYYCIGLLQPIIRLLYWAEPISDFNFGMNFYWAQPIIFKYQFLLGSTHYFHSHIIQIHNYPRKSHAFSQEINSSQIR